MWGCLVRLKVYLAGHFCPALRPRLADWPKNRGLKDFGFRGALTFAVILLEVAAGYRGI